MVNLSPIGNAAQALAEMLQARPADPPSPGEVRETLDQGKPVAHGDPDLPLRSDKETVPQGQAFNAATDEFLTTYHLTNGTKDNKNDDSVELTLQPRTGGESRSVKLGGRASEWLPTFGVGAGMLVPGVDAPKKGGGVATDGEYAYVSDGGRLYVYTLADIDKAAEGQVVEAHHVEKIPASSFVEVHDGKLYVGDFKTPEGGHFGSYQGEPYLHQFKLENGRIDGDAINKIRIPYYVQDVAILPGEGLLFSRSYSNDPVHSPHYLTLQKGDPESGNWNRDIVDWQDSVNVKEIPYYSEGISIVDGDVYVTHESGALKPNFDSSDTQIQRIDLESLNLDGIDGPLDPDM